MEVVSEPNIDVVLYLMKRVPKFEDVDQYLDKMLFGFGGQEEVCISKRNQDIVIEYVLRIQMLPLWNKNDYEKINHFFGSRGWTVGAGMRIWQSFSVSEMNSGNFDEVLRQLKCLFLFKETFGKVYDEFFVAIKDDREKHTIDEFLSTVEREFDDNKKSEEKKQKNNIAGDAVDVVSLDGFMSALKKVGFRVVQ